MFYVRINIIVKHKIQSLRGESAYRWTSVKVTNLIYGNLREDGRWTETSQDPDFESYQLPDRLRGLNILLFNEHRQLLPWWQRGRCLKMIILFHLRPRLQKSRTIRTLVGICLHEVYVSTDYSTFTVPLHTYYCYVASCLIQIWRQHSYNLYTINLLNNEHWQAEHSTLFIFRNANLFLYTYIFASFYEDRWAVWGCRFHNTR